MGVGGGESLRYPLHCTAMSNCRSIKSGITLRFPGSGVSLVVLSIVLAASTGVLANPTCSRGTLSRVCPTISVLGLPTAHGDLLADGPRIRVLTAAVRPTAPREGDSALERAQLGFDHQNRPPPTA